MRACSAILIVLALGSSSPASADGSLDHNLLAEFKFSSYSGVLRVPVRIRGVDYNFVMDTGCVQTSFDEALRPMLGKTSGSVAIKTMHRSRVQETYRAPPAAIGPVNLAGLSEVCCMDHSTGTPLSFKIYGYLGMDVMRHVVIHVDFDRGAVSLLRSVPRDPGVPVLLDNDNPCPVVKVNIGGISRNFILDTGCHIYGAGGISNDGFERLLRRGELETIDHAPVESDFDVRTHRVGVLIAPLSIGGFKHRGIALADLGEGAPPENILGVGYLRRYNVTFDFPNKTVYLKPGANFNQIDASRELGGLRLRRVNNRVVVSGLGWNSPAATAGVKVNDLLKTINGQDASAADDGDLVRQLSHRAKPTSLIFYRQSSGEVIEYVYRLNERGVTELCIPQQRPEANRIRGRK